ncbi:MAG TPA: ribonuclease domain-containing protein [Burkholderiales bacterium]|nr:ribonuclease domain-containing protein [Burkholderiales bacterium]
MLARASIRFLPAIIGGLILAVLLAAAPSVLARGTPEPATAAVPVAQLPAEARTTLALIRAGGPFPYERDGIMFGNFERRLPPAERGYYREYTVATPGLKHRGARRIVAGRGGELYYTADHYRTFRRILE